MSADPCSPLSQKAADMCLGCLSYRCPVHAEDAIGPAGVEPIPSVNGGLEQVLASVDTLRSAWERALSHVADVEFGEARKRSLRRHAIETGIIERLYDLSWGVTEALVAEGIAADVAAREGSVDENALAIIHSQYDALEFLVESVRDSIPLTAHFVRQLHQLVCREQRTYEARDQFGRAVHLPLHHGRWKTQPNQVLRQDGTVLHYTAPEHVQSAVDELLAIYADEEAHVHPVVMASWLHHRFLVIHPFEDGNGRVGRALTLLVLLKARYAPLVVDRTVRNEYIDALDTANDGDLAPLIRLFARLEIVALRSELERPVAPAMKGNDAVDVARAYVDRLRSLQDADRAEKVGRARELADDMHESVDSYVRRLGDDVAVQFAEIDPQARAATTAARPPDPQARYWKLQLVRTAREVDFFSNLSDGSWWVRLHLTVLGTTLRYVVAVQRVGHGDTGVLAVTVFAEALAPPEPDPGDRALPVPLLRSTPSDSVTMVYSDAADARWPEVRELIDRTLAAAVSGFAGGLG